MLKNLDRFVVHMIVVFVLVAYFQLFKFIMIPYSIRIASQILACGLMLALIILRIAYQTDYSVKMNFAAPIIILIISAIPSYFVAMSSHNQSFLASISANHVIWFYLVYFFLHYYKVSSKYIIHLVVIMGLFVVGLFYLQLVMYPKMLMDINVFRARGTLRLVVPGMLCAQLAYFYFLNRFLKSSKFGDFLLSLIVLSIFIIQGSRQLIFAIIFLTLIMLFFSNRVKGRSFKIFILGMASVAVFFVFRDIFLEMTRVSTSQVNNIGEGIRIKAARFFLTSFQSDEWSYIFGNSREASGGMYFRRMQLYSFKYGFFLSDIGIIGDYVRYGIVFVLTGLIMISRSIGFRMDSRYSYLKYYIVMQCFTLLTGKGLFGGVDIILLLILYIFDVDRSEKEFNTRRSSAILTNVT